jgi:hypothetical protein
VNIKEDRKFMSNILDSFVAIAPYINQLTNNDFAVSVCDLEKCLIYVPSEKQNHNLKSGTPHVKNSVAYECIVSGKKKVRRVGSEVFGFPYIAIAVPVFDENNKVEGCVCFTEAVDTQDLLLALTDNLHSTIQQMLSIVDIINENSMKLKRVREELKVISVESNKRVDDTDSILNFIRTVSQKTNMLGIKALVEASKIGGDGSEFKEVAEEIRNLSTSSDDYILDAYNIIKELRSAINEINGKLEDLLSISSNQIDINTYINSMTKNLDERAEKIKEYARLLSE